MLRETIGSLAHQGVSSSCGRRINCGFLVAGGRAMRPLVPTITGGLSGRPAICELLGLTSPSFLFSPRRLVCERGIGRFQLVKSPAHRWVPADMSASKQAATASMWLVIGTTYFDAHPTATYSDRNATQHLKWWPSARARQKILENRKFPRNLIFRRTNLPVLAT